MFFSKFKTDLEFYLRNSHTYPAVYQLKLASLPATVDVMISDAAGDRVLDIVWDTADVMSIAVVDSAVVNDIVEVEGNPVGLINTIAMQ